MSEAAFQGPALNAIDAKGRLLIPAGFRDVIAARGGGRTVKVSIGLSGRRCLMAYSSDYADRLKSEFDARHGVSISPQALAERNALFGSTLSFAIDEAGRIVLPPGAKRAGAITGPVLFMGMWDFFELWDPWTYLANPLLDDGQRWMVEGELEAKGLPLERPA
ncbi:MAG: hypothetical protein KGQ52_03375 [Alphaproteobacteria bacterium]|nr:hypothetical protein [Alphaproteobacteria bacterium]